MLTIEFGPVELGDILFNDTFESFLSGGKVTAVATNTRAGLAGPAGSGTRRTWRLRKKRLL